MPTEIAKEESAPLALLVEDDPQSLRIRREMLNEVGFATVAVQNEQDALREFIASPGVDLVITDIRLHPKRPRDKSGVNLARRLKAITASLPIVGYSAAFAENELTEDERSLFTSYYERGGSDPTQIIKHFDQWRSLAQLFRFRRLEETRGRLEEFRQKYSQPEPEYSILRFLVPHRLLKDEGDISSVEDVLRDAGFQLRVVDRGDSRPTLDEVPAPVRSPILMWLRSDRDAVVAEVYGFPELYSFGDTEAEAIRNVLLLMDGFHRDLTEGLDYLSDRMAAIAEFLQTVFG